MAYRLHFQVFVVLALLLIAATPSLAQPAENTAILEVAWQSVRAEAIAAAGGPGDIRLRAPHMKAIYDDSRGNHAFPLVALHGALWAATYFPPEGTLGRLAEARLTRTRLERKRREIFAKIRDFELAFKDANRQVFIDTYTNYWFTKRYGSLAGADRYVPCELLAALSKVHEAARTGVPLGRADRREVFRTSLLFEQESTVSPRVKDAVRSFDGVEGAIVKPLALKPDVRFAYFPRGTELEFDDFSDKEERIRKALRAYDLADRAGWPKVVSTLDAY